MHGASNIAVLIPEFPGQTHIFFWREIQALRDSGQNAYIVSTRKPREKNFHEFCENLHDTFYLSPMPVLRVLGFCLGHLFWLMRALAYCIRLKGSFRTRLRTCLFIPFAANLIIYSKSKDIHHIHVHSSADAAHVAALAALSGSFTYSVCIHGNLNQYGDNHQFKLQSAACIITVTKPLKAEVLATIPDYPPERVHVLPMGVDISKFLPRSYSDRHDKPYIITSVSRLAFVKGHTFALRALAELPEDIEFRYQIVGDGEMRSKLEQEVESLGLAGKVEFLGFRREGEVYEILQNTDVFMLTSFGFGEAAPVAIMEAMACGVAPICSIIGGTKDMISDNHDGLLVQQKSVDDIKRALLYLLQDPARLKIIGKNARDTAEKRFCHRSSANTLLQHIIHC
ncbi:glycosyltransferase family 4 protein [Microbulbifer salipaludis]|uniref:Glycosyltransferase family 4 protein n=1 Tax=Microbulbifer salipaludis TaxID=187980 RepID=A0ABS3E2E6_9GAMM|nr:glycosyltransferase family 4 protein [Microbulbifer salipaludis]MBN8429461.1 glycosyltransferase family 4 protein [Microbulbifer salipaludis]